MNRLTKAVFLLTLGSFLVIYSFILSTEYQYLSLLLVAIGLISIYLGMVKYNRHRIRRIKETGIAKNHGELHNILHEQLEEPGDEIKVKLVHESQGKFKNLIGNKTKYKVRGIDDD